MQLYGYSDVGKVRQSNQDAYINMEIDAKTALSIVCDGMGGANAGNIASQITMTVIADYVRRSYDPIMNESQIEIMLKSAVETANIEVYDASMKNSEYSGMGTTVVAALIRDDKAFIVHVGDSRAYLISDTGIERLTRDHSVIQNLIESGHLTAEQARSHPKRNIITRAIGIMEDVQCDFSVVDVKDRLLVLCTDGLTGMLSESEIFSSVVKTRPERLAEDLAEMANTAGGEDNITVTVIDVN